MSMTLYNCQFEHKINSISVEYQELTLYKFLPVDSH